MKRSALGLLAAGLLAAVGLIGWSAGWPAGPAGAGGEGGGDWAEVRRGDLVVSVPVTGELEAVESTLLGPPQVPDTWEYKIAFMAPEGSQVRRGMPVLRFDSSELEQGLLEKAAERDAAEKELEKKSAALAIARGEDELRLAEARARQRKAGLKVDVPPDLVSRVELSEARSDQALAGREVEYLAKRLLFARRRGEAEIAALAGKRDRAAARVREAEEAIRRMTVAAPRDGTVVYFAGRRGEKKKVGDSCWQMDKVIEIPDLSSMRAVGEVGEADAGRLAVGQRVRLALDAHPDAPFAGRVRAIRDAVRAESENRPAKVVELDVALDRTDPRRMRPGMRFQGEVEVERVAGALLVPAQAVFATAAGPRVYRRSLWSFEAVSPRLGRRNQTSFEVLGGLAAGDRVSRRDLAAGEGA